MSVSRWYTPDPNASPFHGRLMGRMAAAQAVLLGLRHDRAAQDCAWLVQVLSGLAAHRRLLVGLDMLPARHDWTLRDWILGDLNEFALLERLDWGAISPRPAQDYMPLLRACREIGLPMVALGDDGAANEACTGNRPDPFAFMQSPQTPDEDEAQERHIALRIRESLSRPGRPLVVAIVDNARLDAHQGMLSRLSRMDVTDLRLLRPRQDEPATHIVDWAKAAPASR